MRIVWSVIPFRVCYPFLLVGYFPTFEPWSSSPT